MFNQALKFWASHQGFVSVVVLIMAIAFPFVFPHPYVVHVATLVLMYSVLALSLNLMTGGMGIVSLGHAAFVGIGAYTAAILATRFQANLLVILLSSAALSALCGLLLGLPTLRLTGKYLSIVTLSFGEVARIVELNWFNMTRGPLGLANILPPRIGKFEFDTPFKQYFLILSIATFSAFIIYRLMHSEIGLAITALKNDEKAAAAMGIKPHKYRLLAFLLSSLIAGVGGAFYAQYIGFIDPNSFSFEQSLQILSMTIIGGLNSIAGSFLGAFFLTALPEVLRPLISIRFVIYGALLVVMIMVRPQGILGGFNLEHIRQRVLAEKGKK